MFPGAGRGNLCVSPGNISYSVKRKVMHMKILLTAFAHTSSEKLIRRFDGSYGELVLVNHKEKSVYQLISAICADQYDYIIAFGQKPVIKDKVYIELQGRIENKILLTDFDTDRFASCLANEGLFVRFSHNAGTSFCNHIYANGLKYISENGCGAKMCFVHVPFEKNISDFHDFSDKLVRAITAFRVKE